MSAVLFVEKVPASGGIGMGESGGTLQLPGYFRASEERFLAQELEALAAREGLRVPRPVLASLVAALESGKHIMLTGPPGSGKTSLAFLVAELAKHTFRSNGYLAATATTDWDVGDTIGRYWATPEGPIFREGFILEAIQRGRWLIIDEMNRADFDKAFGPLFTTFTNQPVTLPFKRVGHSSYLSLVPPGAEAPPQTEAVTVPQRWRIIATINEFDKQTLFRMSFALMRRFAFIEVEPPEEEVMIELIGGPKEIACDLLVVRRFVNLGPGLFIDAANYARRRAEDGDATRSRILFEAFYAFFLRQLHLLDETQGWDLLEALTPSFDPPEAFRLRQLIGEMLLEQRGERQPVERQALHQTPQLPRMAPMPPTQLHSTDDHAY
jgi:energy-coupling factor transporter ATP-binding protein EcfA2